jgi:hypothetical protein
MILPKSPMAMAVFVLIRVVQVGVERPERDHGKENLSTQRFGLRAVWMSALSSSRHSRKWSFTRDGDKPTPRLLESTFQGS